MNDHHDSTVWPTGEPGSGRRNFWQPGRDLSRAIQALPGDLESRLTWQLYLETHGHYDQPESAPLSASYLARAIGKKLQSRGLDERGEPLPPNQAPKSVRKAIKRLVAEGVWEVVNPWTICCGETPEYRLQKDPRRWGDLTPDYIRDQHATLPADDTGFAATPGTDDMKDAAGGRNDPTLGSERPHPLGSEHPHPWGRNDPQVKRKNSRREVVEAALAGGGDVKSSWSQDTTSASQNEPEAGDVGVTDTSDAEQRLMASLREYRESREAERALEAARSSDWLF